MSTHPLSSHDAARWRRVEDICDAALRLSESERDAYLIAACGSDQELRREIDGLLAHAKTAEKFLTTPLGAIQPVAEPPRDLIGKRIADYHIVAKLGEGGMGEVYRARDEPLGRDVAIKVLPAAVAGDAERLKRFEREARLLARINHASIGAIYGLVEAEGMRALVLELVDGETLSAALARGPLKLERALALAAQIADALDHAHRRGITHRDLKPSNIMLAASGIKLLDFGIGKWSPGGDRGLIRASTLTGEGAIVGTLHYMSPEQLEGRDTDARSDIFAFGAVLYEMVSGAKAFDAKSQAGIIAAVLEAPAPKLTGVGGAIGPRLERIVTKCLAKHPDDRWQSAHDLGDELRWLRDDVTGPESTKSAAAAMRGPSTWLTGAAAAIAMIAIGIASWGAWERWRAPAPPNGLVRFEIHPPPSETYSYRGFDISPDGKQLAYADTLQTTGGLNTGRGIWMRRFDRFESFLIPETVGASWPRFSPDGQWLAYTLRGTLRKLRVSGDAPSQIVSENIGAIHGLTWGQPGTIFISASDRGLRRINADGGAAVEFTKPHSNGEVDHHSPFLFQDGRNLLVAVHRPNNRFSIAVQPIDGGARTTILESGFAPSYLPSGHLLFGSGSTILAATFDASRLKVTGPHVALVERVDSNPGAGVSEYRLSSSGALAYIPQRPRTGRTLTWMTSDGTATPIAVPAGALDTPRVSPDGTQIAYLLEQEDGRRHIWIYASRSGRRAQVTHEGDHWAPAWTKDGLGLVYARVNASGSEVVHHPLGGEAVTLARSTNRLSPAAFTPDSQTLLLNEVPPNGEDFISQLDTRRPATISKLPLTGREPRGASLSPDGKWIAFAAYQANNYQVFVQRFPPSGTPRQISVEGGSEPRWSRDGQTLFFRTAGRLYAVSIDTTRGLTWTSARVLFEADVVSTLLSYDVAPDGRLVMIARDPHESSPPQFNIILNWAAELRSRVPVPR